MIQIGKVFEEAEQYLRLKFLGWEQDIPHHGEKGGLRERRVTDFLASVLPKRYGIGTGHVVDNQGNTSNQSDIVIYDAVDSIILPIDNHYSLFPCESVFGVIEVKSTLTASHGSKGPDGTIFDCIRNTQRVRSLNRTNKYRSLPAIVSVVFAYQVSDSWKSNPEYQVIDWFEKLGEQINTTFPDLIFVLDPGFVIYPLKGNDKDGIQLAIFKWNSLLQFSSQLIRCLAQTKTEMPNLWYEYQYPSATEDTTVGEIDLPSLRKKRRGIS